MLFRHVGPNYINLIKSHTFFFFFCEVKFTLTRKFVVLLDDPLMKELNNQTQVIVIMNEQLWVN